MAKEKKTSEAFWKCIRHTLVCIRMYIGQTVNWIGLDWTGLAKVESRQGGKQTTKMAAAGSRDLGLATYTLVSVG